MKPVYKTYREMKTFLVIWVGQLVSLIGSAMMRFALILWAYQQTGEATTLALFGFVSWIAYLGLAPFAGILIDRWDRRLIMLCADLLAALLMIVLLILYTTNSLQIWHVLIAELMLGAFEAFQMPAYAASITLLVPKEHFARASGLRSLASDASQVCAPFLAGLVMAVFTLNGVIMFNILSFIIAIIALMTVRIPRPERTIKTTEHQESFWKQISFGFRYICSQRELLWLLLIFFGLNLAASLTYFSVLPALILARTGNDQMALASVQSAVGIGGVVGGIVVGIWGGPKKRINGVLLGALLSFALGDFLFATGRSMPVWVIAGFLGAVFIPVIVSSDRAIWQSRVPADIQGRVFGSQGIFSQLTFPVGMLLGGLLADHVFEPAMREGGSLASTMGWLVGTGPGAGIGLMFICTAIMGSVVALSGYLIPALHRIDSTDITDSTASLPEAEHVTMPQELSVG